MSRLQIRVTVPEIQDHEQCRHLPEELQRRSTNGGGGNPVQVVLLANSSEDGPPLMEFTVKKDQLAPGPYYPLIEFRRGIGEFKRKVELALSLIPKGKVK